MTSDFLHLPNEQIWNLLDKKNEIAYLCWIRCLLIEITASKQLFYTCSRSTCTSMMLMFNYACQYMHTFKYLYISEKTIHRSNKSKRRKNQKTKLSSSPKSTGGGHQKSSPRTNAPFVLLLISNCYKKHTPCTSECMIYEIFLLCPFHKEQTDLKGYSSKTDWCFVD